MNHDPRLERYLSSLENSLRPFPVSDRADIITEIKSHVLAALERDPSAQIDSILSALGKPETVANRYLLERGLKPIKPPVSPIVKWLVAGFLGALAIFFVFAGFLVSKFAPLVHVDGKGDQVSLLGGLVRIDGENDEVTVNGKSVITDVGQSSGSSPVTPGQPVSIRFSTGVFEIATASDGQLSWECSGLGPDEASAKPQDKNLLLDLSTYLAAKCAIFVPENSDLSLVGGNAKVIIDEPHFDIDASFGNAKVTLLPDPDREYRYELKVEQGKVDTYKSSTQAHAYSIKINAANGRISRDDKE